MLEWADKNSIKSVLTKGGTKRSLLELYQNFVHVAWQHDLGGPQSISEIFSPLMPLLIKTLLLNAILIVHTWIFLFTIVSHSLCKFFHHDPLRSS